jgi:hypothetical protein
MHHLGLTGLNPLMGVESSRTVVCCSRRGYFYIPLLRDRSAPFGSVKADCCALRLLSGTRESNGRQQKVTLAVTFCATKMSSSRRNHKADLEVSFEAICLQSRPYRSASSRNETCSIQGTGQRVGIHPPSRHSLFDRFPKTAHLTHFGRCPKVEAAKRRHSAEEIKKPT